MHLDARTCVVVGIGFEAAPVADPHWTGVRVRLDVLGRAVSVSAVFHASVDGDPEGEVVDHVQLATEDVFDLAGRSLRHVRHDAQHRNVTTGDAEGGTTWMLSATDGQPIRRWDSREATFRLMYDALRRPTRTYAQVGSDDEHLHLYTRYGEAFTDGDDTLPSALNLVGQTWEVYDTAGMLSSVDASGTEPVAYDVDGNPLASVRTFCVGYRDLPDWTDTVVDHETGPARQTDVYTTRQSFDALKRPTTHTTPDGATQAFTYDAGGRLVGVTLTHPDATTVETVVAGIRYNARGQRVSATFGWAEGDPVDAGVLATTYRYDPETFRLARLKTTRANLIDAEDPPEVLQDLVYAFDAAGNPTSIWDYAQSTIYFRNTVVEPQQQFTYDALYRLVHATGREHAAHAGGLQRQQGRPYGPGALVHRADENALRNYAQDYVYDPVGNLLRMVRAADAGKGWTRTYAYQNASGSRWNNQLAGTHYGSEADVGFTHDAHGNMTAMPDLVAMSWDLFDRLHGVTKTARWAATEAAAAPDNDATEDGHWDDTDPENRVWVEAGSNDDPPLTSGAPDHDWFYVYDGSGQRVRKVRARGSSGDAMDEERVYLGATWERWRTFDVADDSTTDEVTTVHVMDDHRRVAMWERRLRAEDADVDVATWRFQLENHLGTATGEVTPWGAAISYEEFHPYGTTALWAANAAIEVSGKRYRYTGMERDDETGMQYHSARYYAPWLGRWTAVDPILGSRGTCGMDYANGSPLREIDPQGTVPQVASSPPDSFGAEEDPPNDSPDTVDLLLPGFDGTSRNDGHPSVRLERKATDEEVAFFHAEAVDGPSERVNVPRSLRDAFEAIRRESSRDNREIGGAIGLTASGRLTIVMSESTSATSVNPREERDEVFNDSAYSLTFHTHPGLGAGGPSAPDLNVYLEDVNRSLGRTTYIGDFVLGVGPDAVHERTTITQVRPTDRPTVERAARAYNPLDSRTWPSSFTGTLYAGDQHGNIGIADVEMRARFGTRLLEFDSTTNSLMSMGR